MKERKVKNSENSRSSQFDDQKE